MIWQILIPIHNLKKKPLSKLGLEEKEILQRNKEHQITLSDKTLQMTSYLIVSIWMVFP